MKTALLVVVIGIVSLLISGFIIYRTVQPPVMKPPIKTTLHANVVTYTDPNYAFSFSYPEKYHMTQKVNALSISGNESGRTVTFNGNITVSQVAVFSSKKALLTLCHDLLKANCLIDSQSVFTNINNVTGSSYYFKIATSSALTTDTLRGPIYSFLLPLPNGKSGLLFFYPASLKPTDQEKEILKTILTTLSLPTPIPQQTKVSSQSSHLLPGAVGSASAK